MSIPCAYSGKSVGLVFNTRLTHGNHRETARKPSGKGLAEWFTGTGAIDPLLPAEPTGGVRPGCQCHILETA